MIISEIYKSRIKTLKTEYESFKVKFDYTNNKVKEYTDLNIAMLDDVKKITYDENLDINIKYIKINEKTKFFEKVSTELDKARNEILLEKNKIFKDIDSLIHKISKDNNCDIKMVEKYVLSNIGI